MFERNSRNANNSRNESNNRTVNTQMIAIKSRDPNKNSEAGNSMKGATSAETIGTSQRQQQKGDPQQQY
jgi:hypothetical protein